MSIILKNIHFFFFHLVCECMGESYKKLRTITYDEEDEFHVDYLETNKKNLTIKVNKI